MIFYEICFTYIHRVRVKCKSNLTFNSDKKIIEHSNIIIGDYLIIGDATNKDGLAAPFEEEETEYVGKIEDCGEQNLLDFWVSNPNQDLFSAKEISLMQMRTLSNNPTIK